MTGGARIIAASLIVGSSAASPAQHIDAPSVYGSATEEWTSLASNLDNAIKLCTEESTRAGAKQTDIGSVEKQIVATGILKWIDNPPDFLRAQARGRAARFGQWFDPHATIIVIAYQDVPSCRILVGGTPWAAGVRPTLYAKIQDDHFWVIDGPEQPVADGLVRTTFHAIRSPSPAVRPLISVTAPSKPEDASVQLSIGVHLLSAESK